MEDHATSINLDAFCLLSYGEHSRNEYFWPIEITSVVYKFPVLNIFGE